MINDDLSKKKSPHFREKCLVLSYLNGVMEEVCCSLIRSEVGRCDPVVAFHVMAGRRFGGGREIS